MEDFNINLLIMEALKPLDIPVSYASIRDTGVYPFVTFNVNEIPSDFADDDFHGYEYLIALSLYSKRGMDFTPYKSKIVKLLKDAGLKLQSIPSTQYLEGEEMFNQPFAFSYYNSFE